MGPKAAHYAPTMRPRGAHYVQKTFRSGTGGPKVRPLRAHYPPTICRKRFGVETMGPKGAHYAPTMRPSCPETVLELNRWAHSELHAPTRPPLCP
jgi:hypothetical protein